MREILLSLMMVLGACNPPPPRVASTRAPVVEAPPPSCAIEGDGEPLDSLFFHRAPELTISATRGGPALVRTQGEARYALRGRWTELAPPGGDGRAHLELSKPAVFRISGYADLAAVRFRLRREAAVVPEHVFLQVDSLVRVVGAEERDVSVVYEGPFETPKELSARVHCEDLGYEAVTGKYVDVPEGATDSVSQVRLYDAPHGALRFEGDVGLIFVRTLEERDGFARIDGARHRVHITGWTPRELVDHTPRGSGYGAGGRSASTSHGRGRVGRITHATPLLARLSGNAPRPLGELSAGASVIVFGDPGELVTIALDDVIAMDGAVLLARAEDIEIR